MINWLRIKFILGIVLIFLSGSYSCYSYFFNENNIFAELFWIGLFTIGIFSVLDSAHKEALRYKLYLKSQTKHKGEKVKT